MDIQRLVAPSILAANFTNLGKDIEMLNASEAEYVHCDVMDGIFVPNISFGLPVIEQLSKISLKPLDVHLMIVDPDKFIQPFRNAGASVITVHYEACPHLHRTVQSIRESGAKAGVSLNPHTPVHLLEDIIEELDLVLIMSVNPGFGGQEFIKNAYSKITKLRDMIGRKNVDCLIEVDGGVTLDNALQLYQSGADILVSGSFIFNSPDPRETIKKFKEL